MYTLEFTVIGTGGNTINVVCGSGPDLCETTFVDANGVVQPPVTNTITIDEPTDVNGGAGSGGNGELILTASDECANTGTNVCFDITASDFDDLVGIQHSIHWDPAVLQYTTFVIPNINSINLNTQSFGTTMTGAGTLTFSWNENQNGGGQTVPNGTLLYSLCFNVVGAGGATTAITFDGDPLEVEVTEAGGNGVNIGLVGNAGNFSVKGTGGPISSMSVMAACESVDNGENVCVPITVTDGFDDILGFQWTLNYDPAILDYTGTANNNTLLTTLSANEPNAGQLIFTWNDPASVPQTLADGTTLFEICFDGIGTSGQTSALEFSNVPTSIEGTAADSDNDGNPDLVAISTEDGKVDISNSGGFNAIFCDADACPGDAEICVPLMVTGFSQILGMQWTVSYDNTVLSFTSVSNIHTQLQQAGLFPSSLFEPAGNEGNINFSWFSAIGPVSLMDCDPIFEVCFSVDGAMGSSSLIDLTSNPVSIEITQNNPDNPGIPNIIPAAITAGNLTVNCNDGAQSVTCICGDQPEPLAIDPGSAATDAACNGEASGSVDLIITGGEAPITFSWDNGTTTEDLNNVGAGTYTVIVTDNTGATATQTFTINEPTALTAGISATNESSIGAMDGTASTNPMGGTPPYTYLWMNGATTQNLTGLASGNYSVVITDANDCEVTAEAMVGTPIEIGPAAGPNGPPGSTRITNVACFGESTGMIDLVFSGGMPAFSFNWDNGATTEDLSGLAAGTYCVTITDFNNDTGMACFTIAAPTAALSVTNMTTNESVVGSNNGAIDITVAGGTSPYTYAWSGNGINSSTEDLNGLSAGFYNVVITDANNCTLAMTYEVIAEGTALMINVNASPTTAVSCFGGADGSIDLNVTGGQTPYTFAWSGPAGFSANTQIITGLQSGSYTATVTDANGTVAISSPIFIGAPATPISINGNLTPESAAGASDGSIGLNVSGGTPGYSYNWSNGATTANISGLTANTYSVIVTDANSCTAEESFTISVAGLTITSANPINTACFGECTGAVSITIAGGSAPYSYAWTGPNGFNETTQNVSGLCPGDYSVVVTDNDGTQVNSQVYTIVEPLSALSATANITPETLPGTTDGSIDLTVTGGTAPYSFLWSNSFTSEDIFGLTSTTYTVTITDINGCTLEETYVVEPQGEPLTLGNSVVVEPTCGGDMNGSIDLVVDGGTPPYTFNWDIPSSNEDVSGLFAGSYTVTVTDAFNNTVSQTFILNQPTPMSLIVNSIPESSNGQDGAINIEVNGGTPPYTYAWTGPNGFTSSQEDIANLEEGIYSLVVIDSRGCNLERIVPLGAILGLADADVIDVACNGDDSGEISIQISGGEPPYSYAWTGPNGFFASTRTIDDLFAGTYNVIITDNIGQVVEAQFEVEEPLTPLAIDPDVTIIKQEGMMGFGMINIEVAGGTLPYTYNWSNGSSIEDPNELVADDYKVTITDANGCILVSPNYTVAYCPLPMDVSLINEEDALCNGQCDGSITLQINGGDLPYQIEWSTGMTQTLTNQDPTIFLGDLCAGDYQITITDDFGQTLTRSYTIDEPLQLLINGIPEDDETGGSGSIDITVTGGSAPYSFLWSNGLMSEDIDDLEGDVTYTVTVTDANGCTGVEQFDVDLDPLALTIGDPPIINNVQCQEDMDGSITITVSGGILPYTYLWSNGQTGPTATGLGVGTYSVTVTDAIGTPAVLGPISVTSQSTLSGEIMVTDATLFNIANGTAQVSVTGNQSPFGYLWSNGATTQEVTGLMAGTICVTVTDAIGCTIEICDLIDQPEQQGPLSCGSQILVFEDIECFGDCNGTLMIEPSGGFPPYTYFWSNNATTSIITGLCAGEYSVTVTDAVGDFCIENFALEEPDELSIEFSVTPESAMLSGDGAATAIVTGGTPPYTYQWNNSDGHTTAICENLTAGTYFVVIQDANICQAVDSVQVFNRNNNIPCMNARNIITPDNDNLNDNFMLTCALEFDNTLEIYNRWGQLIYEADNYDNTWEGTNQRGDDVPEGGYFYVFVVTYDDGTQEQFKGHITVLRE